MGKGASCGTLVREETMSSLGKEKALASPGTAAERTATKESAAGVGGGSRGRDCFG